MDNRREFLKSAGCLSLGMFGAQVSRAAVNLKPYQKPWIVMAYGTRDFTLAANLIGHYFQRRHDMTPLEEFFGAPNKYLRRTEDGELFGGLLKARSELPEGAFVDSYHLGFSAIVHRSDSNISLLPREEFLRQRLQLLKKQPHSGYVIKVRPHRINEEVFAFLNSEYRFLCIESDDLIRDAIVQQLAARKGRFTSNFENRELEISQADINALTRDDLDKSLKYFSEYLKFRDRINDKVIVSSREVGGPDEVGRLLRNLGYQDAPSVLSRVDLSRLQADSIVHSDIINSVRKALLLSTANNHKALVS